MIVGAAAGALIGLQFVVLTLIAERPSTQTAEAGAAFATPTILHFSMALFVSALISAPWKTIAPGAMLWGLAGFIGVVYSLIVARRMRRQGAYRPVFEDWLFHVVLPVAGYSSFVLSAWQAFVHPHEALFGVGGAALILLFTGIHNAWDAVAYHVLESNPKAKTGHPAEEAPAKRKRH